MKRLITVLTFSTLILSASACRHNPICPDDNINVQDTSEPHAFILGGTSWKLIDIGGDSFKFGVYQGTEVKSVTDHFLLTFDAGSINGQAPVNAFTTDYTSDKGSLHLGEIAWSDAYCGDGSVEPEFFHRLQTTAYYEVREDTLFIKQHMLATTDKPSSVQFQPYMRFVRLQ
ncbi:MAG TPA: META domain-containing protein [Patescibacteria group bacterium]|nr:META domain-containing protein [Patescibacteria group bacterium]